MTGTQKYSASLLNISAMSYGALSGRYSSRPPTTVENPNTSPFLIRKRPVSNHLVFSSSAITALNLGARQGGFYHNTGEVRRG